MEKNYRQINKDIHYFCLMRPIEPLFGGFGFTSSLDEEEWFECYVDEERYKVDDNYKITLRSIDNRAYEHYYQDDFFSLMYEGCIIPKTSEEMHIERVDFNEPIPNTCAYIHHEGQCIVGPEDVIKVGDKVRHRYFYTIMIITAIDENDNCRLEWDYEGEHHVDIEPLYELRKFV